MTRDGSRGLFSALNFIRFVVFAMVIKESSGLLERLSRSAEQRRIQPPSYMNYAPGLKLFRFKAAGPLEDYLSANLHDYSAKLNSPGDLAVAPLKEANGEKAGEINVGVGQPEIGRGKEINSPKLPNFNPNMPIMEQNTSPVSYAVSAQEATGSTQRSDSSVMPESQGRALRSSTRTEASQTTANVSPLRTVLSRGSFDTKGTPATLAANRPVLSSKAASPFSKSSGAKTAEAIKSLESLKNQKVPEIELPKLPELPTDKLDLSPPQSLLALLGLAQSLIGAMSVIGFEQHRDCTKGKPTFAELQECVMDVFTECASAFDTLYEAAALNSRVLAGGRLAEKALARLRNLYSEPYGAQSLKFVGTPFTCLLLSQKESTADVLRWEALSMVTLLTGLPAGTTVDDTPTGGFGHVNIVLPSPSRIYGPDAAMPLLEAGVNPDDALIDGSLYGPE